MEIDAEGFGESIQSRCGAGHVCDDYHDDVCAGNKDTIDMGRS